MLANWSNLLAEPLFESIRRNISEIFEYANRLKIVDDLGHTCIEKVDIDDELPQDYGPIHQNFEDVVMIGFENEYKEIVGKLVDTEKSLSAISIVAMGGAGKTTLARKVYTSPGAKRHFEAVCWVTVSQKFKGIDLLNDIMKQITGSTHRPDDQMQEHEVGKKIHDFLLQKRYLVVLDDVWKTDTWEQLNRKVKAFPDATNGSRVLLTTRKEDVANHVPTPTNVHPLKKLDEEKSWELFSSKALPSYKRSAIRNVDEFEDLGRDLTKKCDGLPLALAVLGGYLSKNLNKQAWSDILSGWPSTKNGQMMRLILARSYKDLPNHYLRSCFLYLAAFPEDYIIEVSELIELWIAESFIPHTPKHTLEETARNYVTELAQRSLVQVVDRSRAHGWIESIRIHDILHDWCIEEARQDGFLDAIDKTAVSLPKLRFLRVLCIENSTLKDLSSMNQLTTFSLSMNSNIPAEVLNIFANMPHLVDIFLYRFDVVDKLPAEFPQSVRRLVLFAGVIKQDPMPILEKLARLVVVELGGYKGQTMCCSSQGFPQLQELELHHFSIEEWRMEEGTMPKLSHLILQSCKKMRKLPVGLLHLPSLGHLKLSSMPYNPEDDITRKELRQKGCEVESG
ncbi:LOW QUALITY PROTEIN: probable disease resistance RPP8-like protein 2 [Triticum urartu]|uniref:LOW QUALITY PROTEIN: probable disease resistance RPP8-like protein 2 n=1 Tax=Triticum urartu TaxID=4572 RepID=UPI00204365CF|nr:LOW QUALITY PROTEIN: probable disease resistance RPP8-like protein 2 [Triticum urartu]